VPVLHWNCRLGGVRRHIPRRFHSLAREAQDTKEPRRPSLSRCACHLVGSNIVPTNRSLLVVSSRILPANN